MSNRLSVLMTVYNEGDFIRWAASVPLHYADDLVIVEGAYQETIACGAEPRSTDGTLEAINDTLLISEDCYNGKTHYIEANEQTDKDQRNVGLEKIKELNPDGWLLIIDGDEVYTKENFAMIRNFMKIMEKDNKYAAYFKSLTFVNSPDTFCEQEFPRLFKITPGCKFTNDNFMEWKDRGLKWEYPHVIKLPYLRFHHYAFCKGLDQKRFKLKKDWWESRFGDDYMNTGKKFEYDWYLDENNQVWSPNHKVIKYTGKHPAIMKNHPLWERKYPEKK